MTNTYYRVLSYMYDKKILLDGNYMVPYTQSEIAVLTENNKATVNKLFREYVEDGLIIKAGNKYFLTEKALIIMRKMKSIRD